MKGLAGVGITLSTDGRQPAEVAAAVEVELRSRWQGGGRR